MVPDRRCRRSAGTVAARDATTDGGDAPAALDRRWTRLRGPHCARAACPTSSIPPLRDAIAALIEDVRVRGDAAVVEALARFDGVELGGPSELRIGAEEIAAATVAPELDAALDDAIAHCRAFNEQLMARAADWSFEAEPGLRVGEKVTPIASVGLFVPSGKASYPSVAYQLGVPATVAGVAAHRPRGAAGARHGRSRGCGGPRRVPQAGHRRRVPGQRAGRAGRPRLRHGHDPPRAQDRRPGIAGRDVRPGRAAAPRRGHDDGPRPDGEPGDRRRIRRSACGWPPTS